MTRRMIFLAIACFLLASPIFAQTPGGGGGTDFNLPAAYLAMGIASGLCGLGQAIQARKPVSASLSFSAWS